MCTLSLHHCPVRVLLHTHLTLCPCPTVLQVSPTYAFEVGGTPILFPHLHKFMGIRNGIDMELWDPETCIFLPKGFNAESVVGACCWVAGWQDCWQASLMACEGCGWVDAVFSWVAWLLHWQRS